MIYYLSSLYQAVTSHGYYVTRYGTCNYFHSSGDLHLSYYDIVVSFLLLLF